MSFSFCYYFIAWNFINLIRLYLILCIYCCKLASILILFNLQFWSGHKFKNLDKNSKFFVFINNLLNFRNEIIKIKKKMKKITLKLLRKIIEPNSFEPVQFLSWIRRWIPFLTSNHHLLLFINKSNPNIFHFSSLCRYVRWLRSFVSHDWIFYFLIFLCKLIVRSNLWCQFCIVRRLKWSIISEQVFLRLKFLLL